MGLESFLIPALMGLGSKASTGQGFNWQDLAKMGMGAAAGTAAPGMAGHVDPTAAGMVQPPSATPPVNSDMQSPIQVGQSPVDALGAPGAVPNPLSAPGGGGNPLAGLDPAMLQQFLGLGAGGGMPQQTPGAMPPKVGMSPMRRATPL